jgi:cytidylate kinase
MKLVILYGPPAVGKLTVAKELANKTGFKLFHNHLSVDLVTAIFPYGSDIFWNLLRKIRTQMIEAAVKENIDVVFTFVFAAGEDEDLIKSYMKIVEQVGSEVYLVQLKTTTDELHKRVESESRKVYKKIASAEGLKKYMKQYNLLSPIPDRDSLIIDNTNLTPKEVADQVIDHFHL